MFLVVLKNLIDLLGFRFSILMCINYIIYYLMPQEVNNFCSPNKIVFQFTKMVHLRNLKWIPQYFWERIIKKSNLHNIYKYILVYVL
jgi:hypothetical protein